MRLSQTAEGKLAALRAYEADPYLAQAASVLWRLYQSSLDLEDGVEAAKWCAEGGRRFPDDRNFVECQITVYALPGQRPDVARMWQLLDENVKRYPPNQREYRKRRGELLVAMTLVRAGLPDSARNVALRARADATVDPTRTWWHRGMLRHSGDRRRRCGWWAVTGGEPISHYVATTPVWLVSAMIPLQAAIGTR
jgi:hypothetical protein